MSRPKSQFILLSATSILLNSFFKEKNIDKRVDIIIHYSEISQSESQWKEKIFWYNLSRSINLMLTSGGVVAQ